MKISKGDGVENQALHKDLSSQNMKGIMTAMHHLQIKRRKEGNSEHSTIPWHGRECCPSPREGRQPVISEKPPKVGPLP